ncbi:MAG: type II secretion system protein [Candidatus Levybacteria bacterium]|nr:type II secretion system protein [Candidatus Levybacteria bacterium]
MPNSKLSHGFTLVELLASVIVLIAVGSVVAGIVTSSLRGAKKTTVIEDIRQNGNYTLAQIAKNIEYAKDFNGFSDDGTSYATNCPASFAPTPTPVVNFNFIKVTPFDGNPIVYNCTSVSPFTITANGVSLINTNSVAMIECAFACRQNASTDVPIVKVSFKLKPKNTSGLVEYSTPPILFETSVTIRNYRK